MSKAYNDGTSTPFISDNDRPQFGQPVVVRNFMDDEKRWPKWNAAGTDVTVDTAAKASWEQAELPELRKRLNNELIQKIDSEIKAFLSVYPEHEKMSFGIKNEAALRFLAGERPAHTLLSGESMEKYGDASDANVTLIANRIIANAAPYGEIIGRASALRSRYQAEIVACGLSYTLPGVIL